MLGFATFVSCSLEEQCFDRPTGSQSGNEHLVETRMKHP
jgi:hypothetical protein